MRAAHGFAYVGGLLSVRRPAEYLRMTVAEIIDEEIMTHLSLHGCVKNMDPYAQHLLKTSNHPILRFRREWMRAVALQQHLEAERRQKKITDEFKREPVARGASVRRRAVIDHHLAAEMAHYNKTQINDEKLLRNIKAEAPALFPVREKI